jgi:hypothetical protein
MRPAVLAALAIAVALAAAPAAGRPKVDSTGDLLRICETDTIDCLDIFSARLLLYSILHIDEMRRQSVFRDVVETYKDTDVFDGVCLPRQRLTADRDFPDDLSEAFVRWARRHPEAHGLKPAYGVRQAWREAWPCR